MVTKKPHDEHAEKTGHTPSIDVPSQGIVEHRKQKLGRDNAVTLAHVKAPLSSSQVLDAINKLARMGSLGKSEKDRLVGLKQEMKEIGYALAARHLNSIARTAGFAVQYMQSSGDALIVPSRAAIEIRRSKRAEFRARSPGSSDKATAAQSNVANKTQNVAELPHIMRLVRKDIEQARKEFERISSLALPNLTADERAQVLSDAYERDADSVAMAQFRIASAAQPDKPLRWSDRPKSLKLIEFLRMEYRDKGFLTQEGFNRKLLSQIDDEVSKAVASYTRFKALPVDVDIPKAVNRKNEREKAGLNKAENWNRRKPQ